MVKELIGTNHIICPYCKYDFENSWEFGCDEDDTICYKCGKRFHFEREVTVTYNCIPDCELNNKKHEYEKVETTKYIFDQCISCDKITNRVEKNG